MDMPKLEEVVLEADGWVKKYVLKYRLPDGSLFDYHCATRRGRDEYLAELERNAAASEAAMDALASGRAVPAAAEFTPDAVCIVARTPRDTLVMQREFRYPLNSWCVAFPAGLIDPGEDALATAARELEEETGYAVIDGTPMRALPQPGYSSTGLTDETVQIVYVQAEKAGEPHTEGNELIEVFELPIADIDEFVRTNQLPIGTRAQLVLEAFRKSAQ